jgi:hypothetical protein
MQRSFFHFPHIGYRRNPFGALSDEEWKAVSVLPLAVERILAAGFDHLQILGPMGIGKSSTLFALQRWFVEQEESLRKGAKTQSRGEPVARSQSTQTNHIVYEYLPEDQRHFVTNTSGLDIFLLDEAQRLNWWQRRKLVKAASHLQIIFSSHEDMALLFNKKGLSVTSVDLTGEIDEAWITAVLHKRLAYFAISDQPHVTLTPAAIAYLVETFGQNLRQMEYFLYEVWQRLDSIEPVNVSFLRNLVLNK